MDTVIDSGFTCTVFRKIRISCYTVSVLTRWINSTFISAFSDLLDLMVHLICCIIAKIIKSYKFYSQHKDHASWDIRTCTRFKAEINELFVCISNQQSSFKSNRNDKRGQGYAGSRWKEVEVKWLSPVLMHNRIAL